MAGSDPSSSDHQKLIDRLSNLPKHILLHILSFLPTKTAVATSVLSKPWQHLWTLVPAIDLDDDSAPCYQGMPRGTSFEDSLITKVLNVNKSPIIRRFRFTGRHWPISYLDKWVSSATERNVEELDLDFNDVYDDVNPSQLSIYVIIDDVLPFQRPTYAFCFAPESCKTLVIMKLSMTSSTGLHCLIGGDLDFPSLKVLHLKAVGFESRDPSLSGFFSSRFPLLEELAVLRSFQHDINIFLPTLRRLEIDSILKYTLNIEAPNLRYLVVSSCSDNGWFRARDLQNLVEAKVDVFYDYMELCEHGETSKNERREYGESLINFVNALSNASVLNLSFSTMKALSSHSLFQAHRIQPFHNLVELDLQLDASLLDIMVIMLSKFGNLEHLKIREVYDNIYNKTKTENSLVTPTHVPNCLTYHLKSFCYEDFRCSQNEMEFTIYILKNSLVLENVKILFRPRLAWKKGYDSKKILSKKTSRGSSECKLEFDQKVSEFQDIENYSDYSE